MQETNEQREARLNDEMAHRKKTGRNGKLWSIAVLYNYGVETKRHQVKNLYSRELMEFRETVIRAGLMLPVGDGKNEWIVVLPWHIISIDVTRQSKFFEP